MDDLNGALETASLLPEGYMRERTLKVIVARQAQRGDFRDANDCLARISSAEERNKALELMMLAYAERGKLGQAVPLLERITDASLRTKCREVIKITRNTVAYRQGLHGTHDRAGESR